MSGKFMRALARLALSVAHQALMFAYRWSKDKRLFYVALAAMMVEIEVAKEQSRHHDGPA